MKPLERRKVRAGHALWTLVALWAMGGTGIAGAAVYNLYFNNVEQGDNSTATPSVTLQTKGDEAKLVSPSPAPEVTALAPSPSPAPVEVKAAPGATPTETATLAKPEAKSHKFRFAVGLGAIGADVDGYRHVISNNVMIELGYYPLPYLGFNAFGGPTEGEPQAFAGAELELIPLKVNLFGFTDALEFSVMGGGTTLAAAPGNVMSLHLGGRAALNFGERWTVAVTGRANGGFFTTDLGLGVRF